MKEIFIKEFGIVKLDRLNLSVSHGESHFSILFLSEFVLCALALTITSENYSIA